LDSSALKSLGSENSSPSTKGFRSDSKEYNIENFDLEEYEAINHEELVSFPKDVAAKLPVAVLSLQEKMGRFRFRLQHYPGKSNPVHTVHYDPDNIIFYGQMSKEGKTKEGKGVLLQDHSLYCGYFFKDFFEGPGQFIFYDGSLSFYKGFWCRGEMQGKGTLVTESGYCYRGDWVNSLQEGYGEETWPDNSMYKGDFKRGLKNGHGEFLWPSKDRFVGQFVNGDIEGYGTFDWTDGNKYEGRWKGNLMHGKGKYTWSDGIIYEGDYRNGKKDGFGVLKLPNQYRWEGRWKNGSKDGEGRFFAPDGSAINSLAFADKNDLLMSLC
jgi:hypothetical protein